MTIQTVQISNTFNEFRETTNLVIDEVNKLGDGTGNLVVDIITANTIFGASLGIVGDTGNNGSDYISLGSEPLTITGSNGISTIVDTDSSTVIVNLNNTGVSANTYGSASQIPVITVDAQGRITSASNASISSAMTVAGNTGNDVISFATETLRIVGTSGISTSIASGSNTVIINYDNDSVTTEIAANTLVHTFDNPEYYTANNYYDYFGFRAALTESYVIVRPRLNSRPDAYAEFLLYDIETKKLVKRIPSASGQGPFAAIDDYLLESETSIGRLFVYQISTGKLLHTLRNPNKFDSNPAQDSFPATIRIQGDFAIVSNPSDVSFRGTAYVFNYKTGEYVWGVLNPNVDVTNVNDDFGNNENIDIYDNKIIVGARWDDNPGNSGRAFVFNFETQSTLYTVSNTTPTASDEFGTGVAIGKDYHAASTGKISGTNRVLIFNTSDGSLKKTITSTKTFFGRRLRFYENYLFIVHKTGFTVYDVDTDTTLMTVDDPTIFVTTTSGVVPRVDINQNYVVVADYPYPDEQNVATGRVLLYSWSDVRKNSLTKIDKVQRIDFAFDKSIDASSPIFNLPNIASKYTPGELVYNVPSPQSTANNNFGKRTSISNNYFIVSSNSTSNTGNVHVYDLKSGSLRYFLTNPNPVGSNTNDYFGSSLAADDTYLAVGSFEDDTANTDSGKVYVYRIDTGSLLYTLNNPNQNANSENDFFGASGLALANNRIIVGAHGESNTIYSNTGIAYIYNISTFSSNTVNTATTIIYNPEHANNDYFGSSIATDGRHVVIGAYNKTIGANTGAGKAYLFDLVEVAQPPGTLVSNLLSDTSNTDDYFGFSVSMDDEYIVVGAYNKSNGANTSAGAAYIYRTERVLSLADGPNTAIQHVLTNPNPSYPEANDQFGYSVSINDGKLAVGAVSEDFSGERNTGVVYLYDVNYDDIKQTTIINHPSLGQGSNLTANSDFGYHISSNRNYIVASAIRYGGTDNGRAYVIASDNVRDIQVPELSQVERITLSDGTQLTSTTVATRSNTKLTVSSNSGSNDEISLFTDTLRIVGSNGISTSTNSGSNTLTISLDNTTTEIAANTLVKIFDNPNLYEDSNIAIVDQFGYSPYLTNSYIMIPALYENTIDGDTVDRSGLYIYDVDSKKLINFLASDVNLTYLYLYSAGVAKDNYLLIPEFNTKSIFVYNIIEGKLLHRLGQPSANNTLSNDNFGQPDNAGAYRNIAIYEDYAVIGAPYDDLTIGGYAYVFNYKTGQLIYSVQNPNANGTGTNDRFGNSAGIYGDLIIIGATRDSSEAGSVYVINYKTNTVVHTKTLPGGATGSNYYFGKGVAIGQNYFAISTPKFGSGYAGSVWIYNNATGTLVKQLSGNDANIQISDFGHAIEMKDNYLFISGYQQCLVYNIDNDTFYKLNTGTQSYSYATVNDNYLLLSYDRDINFSPETSGAFLYSWKDIKTTSFSNTAIKDIEKIEFSFGKTLDKNSSAFNLPNIATKYAPTELVHRISSPESITSNFFGKKTALTNKYIIASSNSTANTGNVHVYDLKSGTLKYFLTNPNPVGTTANDYFGSTLAADDTYLAVGSFEDDVANTDSGKVYVYQIDTGGLLYTLNNPTANGTSANDFFGTSGLVLANNYIAVGAHGESNTIYSNTGIVYVYSIPTFSSNTINTATRIIYNPEHANNDYFGSSIATDGRFITVGAYNKTVSSNTGAGKAYVFELSTGSLVNKLLPDTSNTNDYFGYSIAMDDEFIAVGAYNKNNGANTAVGNVYIYRTKYISFGSNNVIRHVVTNPNLVYLSANDKFGFSVSLNNRKLAVNAVGERGGGGNQTNAGIIYLYDVDFDSCNLVNVIYQDDFGAGIEDEFGYNIASNRNYIVTTAEFDSPSTDAGRVYVYSTRNVRDIQVPEISQVERITFAGGMELTPTTLITTNNISSFTSTATGSSSNGASTLVQRDAEGNFSSNKVAANVVRLNGTVSGYVELKSASATSPVVYTLPTSDGTSGQVLQTNGTGGLSWVPQTGGGSPTGSGVSTARTLFTATAGQTVFTVPYVAGQIDVFMNGAKLVIGSDVTATNNTSISLTDPAASGDIIETVVYTSQWSTSGTSMFANTGLNVGIGTATPGARLHVASANTAFAIGQIRLDGANNAGNVNATVMFNAVTGGATNQGSQLYIETEDDSGILRERIRFDNQGRIGVGTQTPNSTLDVIGTITATYIAAPIVPRVTTITTSASITPNANTTDQYNITALAANTTFNVPTGIPSEGQKLMIKIKDNGAARGLTWTTTSGGYRAVGTTLPTTTSGNSSNVVYVGCIYNSQDVFWDVIAVTAS